MFTERARLLNNLSTRSWSMHVTSESSFTILNNWSYFLSHRWSQESDMSNVSIPRHRFECSYPKVTRYHKWIGFFILSSNATYQNKSVFHESLESSRCISKAEWHSNIFIESKWSCCNYYQRYAFRIQLHLPIPRFQVQLSKHTYSISTF